MRRTETWLHGLVKKETVVFIDKHIEHIEIVETTVLFGFWKVKEEAREVFLPHVKTIEKGKLRAIVDVLLELQGVAKRLKEEYE